MSAKASDVAARLGRSLAPTTAPAVVEPPSVPTTAPTKPARATERFTIDLAPDLNDALGEWGPAGEAEGWAAGPEDGGRPRLAELLLEDASLSAAVDERLTR